MKITLKILLMAIIAIFAISESFGQDAVFSEVVGAGSAVGDGQSSREQALADAMRNAVRNGAGVELMNESKVTNFVLEYDKVMTRSFGYIRDYKIIEQGYDKAAGTYNVKIKATVGKGSPDAGDAMAIKALIARKGSPRIIIKTQEKIAGLSEQKTDVAKSVISEIALELGFQVVDEGAADSSADINAKRDELLNKTAIAQARKAGISSKADFMISADVGGTVGPIEEAYEVKSRDLSLGAEMKAVWLDSGESMAALTLPVATVHGKDFFDPINAPDQFARKYLISMLKGDSPATKEKNVMSLFKKIMARWISDLDLGARIKIEIAGIDKDSLDKLKNGLSAVDGIPSVWIREFDSAFLSVLECDSKLETSLLKNEIQKILGDRFILDRYGRNLIQFARKDVAGQLKETPPPRTDEALSGQGTSKFSSSVVIIAAAIVVGFAIFAAAVVVVAVIVFKRKK
ncbi:MAG TPA: hypothetical protein PK821_00080 [Victivallales bacterium]|nr:hypothetical protein [Victivallales bacterium]